MTAPISKPKQLTLTIEKPISLLLQEMKATRHPQAIQAIGKLEEALYLFKSLQIEAIKSETARTAIQELLTKF
jgi:hypothetical protein